MKSALIFITKHTLGFLITLVVFAASGAVIGRQLNMGKPSDPGVFSDSINLLIIVLIQYITLLTINSAVNGGRIRKFSYTAVLYYMLVIFVMQLETFYFKDQIGITTNVAIWLFFFGAPLAIATPLYLNLYPGKSSSDFRADIAIKSYDTAKFVTMGSVIYVVVYVVAGYYLAWIHEEVRLFYGSQEELRSFPSHLLNLFEQYPALLFLQLVRGGLWSILAFLLLREIQNRPLWFMALSLAFLMAIPQNIAHIGQNPVITNGEVRLIHMVETVSSMIFYGVILAFLFQKITKKRLIKK